MRTSSVVVGFVLLAIGTTGCGQSQPAVSTLGPSPLPRAGAASAAQAASTAANGVATLDPALADTLTITGNITVATGTCPALTLTVGTQVVGTTAATAIVGGTCTDLAVGRTVTIAAAQQADGTLLASSVTLVTAEDPIEPDEIEGTVSSVQGACPVMTFVVHGQRTVVDATTAFVGGSCAAIAPGSRVKVQGHRAENGTLVATTVQFTRGGDDDDGSEEGGGTHISGTVLAAPTGTCPAVTFTVGTQVVNTTAATTYDGGACAGLAAGARVEIDGVLAADGTLTAALVLLGEETAEAVEMRGQVSVLRGACPTLTFNLRGFDVATTSATAYTGGTCASLKAGVAVEVSGARAGERAILATEIRIVAKGDDPLPTPTPTPPGPRPIQVELEGLAVGVGGTCPTLTFSVSGVAVQTSAATGFKKDRCAAVREGVRVEVKGTRTGDGPVAASRVSVEM